MRLADLIKAKIGKEIGYEAWYGRHIILKRMNDQGECRIGCIVHQDSTPSASLNVENGLWNCFVPSCGAKGDCIEFYRHLHGLKTFQATVQRLAMDLGLLATLDDALVNRLHQQLIASPEAIQIACEQFGVQPEILRTWKIGLHLSPREVRFTIPVEGVSGLWEDIRCYNARYGDTKIRSWAVGHGGARIWPLRNLITNSSAPIYLFEGEKDTLRALSLGLKTAITVTSGAGSLPDDYEILFRDKRVILCYDVDDAGVEGARKVARRLSTCAAEIHILHLPAEGLPANGDFSDWCNLGHTLEEFSALEREAEPIDIAAMRRICDTSPVIQVDEPGIRSPARPLVETSFDALTHQTHFQQPVRFLAHCTGQSVGLPEYALPTQVVVRCPRRPPSLCNSCAIFGQSPDTMPWTFDLDAKQEAALELVRCARNQQQIALKRFLGVNERCYAVRIDEAGRQSVQTLLLTPPVEPNRMRTEVDSQGHRIGYYHGPAIADNRDYWFSGHLQTDPKTRESVLNLHHAEPARHVLDAFSLTDAVRSAVQFFHPLLGDTLADHMERLHTIIEDDVGIYGRSDLQMAVLETIYSVRSFRVGDRVIENGWNEILIIGDTRTGKSMVALGMMRMINVGEHISCENTTRAGLIGGIQYVDKLGIPKWGAWPRNNDGMICLDEVDHLSRGGEDLIESLSAMRSNGWAEITKIITARTAARVRCLMITNPPEGTPIRSYHGGVRAIPQIFRSRQDIARFTKAYCVSSDDVPMDVITNSRPRRQEPLIREYFNGLAMLVWSLAPDQIHFSQAAQDALKEFAQKLVLTYVDTIPLIDKGSCLDKLAKLSIPVAALAGSFREQEGALHLQVETQHVIYAVYLLDCTYCNPVMGYDTFSRMEFESQEILEIDMLRQELLSPGECGCEFQALAKFFLKRSAITRQQFAELVGDAFRAQMFWARLIRSNCLDGTHRPDMYQKTAAFTRLLEAMLMEEKLQSRAERTETEKRDWK